MVVRRGKPLLPAHEVLKRYLKLQRHQRTTSETLAHRVVQAVLAAKHDGVSPKEADMEAAGKLLFRSRSAAEVLRAHILVREGFSGMGTAYATSVPWARGSVTLVDVAKVVHIHACFKIASGRHVLSMDPVTCAVSKLVKACRARGVTEHDTFCAVVVATTVAHAGFTEHVTTCAKAGSGLADAVRAWDKRRFAEAAKAFVPASPVHRNRFHSALNAEKVYALLSRLDRMPARTVAHLEAALQSPLMFPHVLKAVQQFKLVDDEVAPAVSSTNVATLHNIFRALDPGTPRSRADWLAQLCSEVKALFAKDLAGCRKAAERKTYEAILAELTPSSCAWNACKVGCVLHAALGGATHMREGRTNPVQVRQGLAACKVRAYQRKRANKQGSVGVSVSFRQPSRTNHTLSRGWVMNDGCMMLGKSRLDRCRASN